MADNAPDPAAWEKHLAQVRDHVDLLRTDRRRRGYRRARA